MRVEFIRECTVYKASLAAISAACSILPLCSVKTPTFNVVQAHASSGAFDSNSRGFVSAAL